MKNKIYTLGYEKRTIDQFIEILLASKVDILVDVRETAWSYKRDFCKTKFTNALSEKGIQYLHVKQAGNPKRLRKEQISHEKILGSYKKYLHSTNAGISEISDIFQQAKRDGKSICLTCFEKEHQQCHRSILVDHLIGNKKTIKVCHL